MNLMCYKLNILLVIFPIAAGWSVVGSNNRFTRNHSMLSKSWKKCKGVTSLQSSETEGNTIEVATLSNLAPEDYESEGQRMAESIGAWLDQEWIAQEVHLKAGMCAKDTMLDILEEKGSGVDIGDVMMLIIDRLNDRWYLDGYSDDMFVNAWDIGNYVSDYLIQRMGIGACACSTAIVEPMGDENS